MPSAGSSIDSTQVRKETTYIKTGQKKLSKLEQKENKRLKKYVRAVGQYQMVQYICMC